MWRANKPSAVTLCAGAWLLAAAVVVAAPPPEAGKKAPAEGAKQSPGSARAAESAAAIEAYLDRPGLRRLLAEHLASRLKSATGEEKAAIGERLGKLYVEFIGSSKKAGERQGWEEKARELLAVMPDVKSHALRLELLRTSYSKAEEIAERWRLRLAGDDEKADAERSLRELKGRFQTIGSEQNRRILALEKAESGQSADIAEARRLRSIAYYYAGWSSYYLAFLANSSAAAVESMADFGWLLGGGADRPAALARLPRNLLKYDHVARAAIGCALAASLRRDGGVTWDVEAGRWLDEIEKEPELAPEIRSQILTRRIAILGAGKLWANLDSLIRFARREDRDGSGPAGAPLETLAARLLAVTCFEADRSHAKEYIERLGQVAMSDLVARGEVGHVLDLAQRYGTAPLGDTGFIVNYVRGMQAYEKAVKAHKEAGGSIEEPSTDAAVMNAYRQSAALLDAAPQQDDAARFPAERGRAMVTAGRALFKAGDFVRASERFSQASTLIPDKAAAEEALWLAIIALDRVSGESVAAVSGRLEELTTLFLKTYPQTERAASLLVRRAGQGGIDDEQAVSILMGVDPSSPVYLSSRRQAARILYRMFRAAAESGKGFAAGRFVNVAEELLAHDKKLALEAPKAEAMEAAERVVLLTRQVLDALLTSPTPDALRAEAALDLMRSVVNYNNYDLAALDAELKFRRLQVLVAREDHAGAERLADELRTAGGRFADAADRLLYQKAVARWRRLGLGDPKDPAPSAAAAATVVKLGGLVLDRIGSGPGAMADNAVLTLHRTVAQAAAEVWAVNKSVEARDLAIRLDKAVLGVSPGATDSLQRLAALAEEAGDSARALECWRMLASGHKAGTPEWFGAKYNAARLLGEKEPAKAAEVLGQVQVLYPDFGGEPWGPKLKALLEKLKSAAPPGASAGADAPPPTPAGAGGGSR